MAISKVRLAAIAAGLCADCQRVPAAPDRRRCADCLAYVAGQERERRARRRAESPKRRKARVQRVRRLLAAKRLSYVTLKRRRQEEAKA